MVYVQIGVMIDETRGESTHNAVLPEKQFLTEDELAEVWETRGLKWRVDELFKFCRERGLLPSVRQERFRKKVRGILRAFLCDGDVRRDPRFVPPLKRSRRL